MGEGGGGGGERDSETYVDLSSDILSRIFPTTMEINNSVFHRRLLFITLFPGRL